MYQDIKYDGKCHVVCENTRYDYIDRDKGNMSSK